MKRFFVLLLCMMLMATAALAGTASVDLKRLTDTVGLVYLQPDDVKSILVEDIYDMKVLTYTMADASMPVYVMTISHSEVLDGRNIGDLSKEEIENLVSITAYDSEAFQYETVEMDDGWPAVHIVYEGESDWVDAFTVIEGYLVQVHGYHLDFSTLTDEEDQMVLTLLDTVDIIELDPEDGGMASMINPMEEATEEAFVALTGAAPALPEDAEAVQYFQYGLGTGVVEVQFTFGGVAYTFRAAPGEEAEDISGIYNTFEKEEAVTVAGIEGTLKINEGAQGFCQWFDAENGINYNLSAVEGATSEGLAQMAGQLMGAE